MSPADPRPAALALRAASQALGESLAGEDEQAIAVALARRESALAGLADALDGATGLAEDVVRLVEDVRRQDAESLALAQRRLTAVGDELDQVRRARKVARHLTEAVDPPARFVDKRV